MSDPQVLGILQNDLTDVSTERPVLPEGIVELKVTSIKVKENEKTGKTSLQITLATIADLEAQNGAIVHPGFPLTTYIGLVPNDKGTYTEEDINRNLAQFKEAALGTKEGAFMPLEQYDGCVLTANIGIEIDESGEYPDRNRIKNFFKKGDAPEATLGEGGGLKEAPGVI
jgi:hypothetical protein